MSATSLYKTFGIPQVQAPGLVARVSAALQDLVQEWRLRRAALAVGSLDDAMLHDIGITRGEIENAVRNGRRRS